MHSLCGRESIRAYGFTCSNAGVLRETKPSATRVTNTAAISCLRAKSQPSCGPRTNNRVE
ncbi:hypothetical protein D3C79_1010610 [compost metagenome]